MLICDLVVGARPNLVKAAAILEAAKKFPQLKFNLVHTGQHNVWADIYWRELGLPKSLNTHSYAISGWEPSTLDRLGRYLGWLETIFKSDRPDCVMVVGDTDSTLAGALAAAKLGIPVAHVEAGLRCGDMKMQEEINRRLVDSISMRHYATTEGAIDNLHREGHVLSTQLVGNVMIDTLFRFLPEARKKYQRRGQYAVLTLHRAETVDSYDKLLGLLDTVNQIGVDIPIIWPKHPRVKEQIDLTNIQITEPMGYLEFIALLDGAKFVITDSGGVQEETTALGVPCMTVRENTERPETCRQGTNVIVGTYDRLILDTAVRFMNISRLPVGTRIPKWDGCAAERILRDLCAI